MSSLIIRIGDFTTHGGQVISGSSDVLAGSIRVAHVGCLVTCPLHPGIQSIITGNSTVLVNGQPIATELNSLCSCGATCLPSIDNIFVGG